LPIPDDPLLLAAWHTFEPVSEQVLLVGGAVRDSQPNRQVRDWDLLVVGCTEEAFAMSVYQLERDLGLHPVRPAGFPDTIRLTGHAGIIDCTRMDPDNLKGDLMRRDFTVNAVAQDLRTGALIDPTGGLADIRSRLLRAPSADVFTADPVRILRLFRFRAELDFHVEPATVEAAFAHVHLLDRPSGERIREELFRLLALDSGWPALGEMADPVLTALFPSLAAILDTPQNGYHHLGVFPHTLEVVKHTFHLDGLTAMLGCPDIALSDEDRVVLRLAALFHDVGKGETLARNETGMYTFKRHQYVSAERFRQDIEGLRPSNRLVERVYMLIRRHMLFLNFMLNGYSVRSFRRLINMMRDDTTLLVLLALADKLAARGPLAEGSIEQIVTIARDFLALDRAEGEHIRSLPALVTGHEVMKIMELDPSPAVGQVLGRIMERQLDDPSFTREAALALLHEWQSRGENPS